MTKAEAIRLNRKMWRWISTEIERQKRPIYPKDFLCTLNKKQQKEASNIFPNLFVCGYIENSYNSVEYDKSVGGKHLNCAKCLLDWGSHKLYEHACHCCIGYTEEGKSFDNLMKKWYDCIKVNEKDIDLKLMSEIAMKISMRPERKLY